MEETFNGKILIVDYDERIKKVLAKRLTTLGYEVFLSSNGKSALTIFNAEKPDLIILEILLPNINGYELCSKIREISKIPIIILTGLQDISARITGLELGADDYIVKPFAPKELEARIRTVFRRSSKLVSNRPTIPPKKLSIANVIIDVDKQYIIKNNSLIKLTNIEFHLLEFLIDNRGKSLSRKLLLENIWGFAPERDSDERVVDVHISRLRSKLEDIPSKPELILTVRGIGYKFHHYI